MASNCHQSGDQSSSFRLFFGVSIVKPPLQHEVRSRQIIGADDLDGELGGAVSIGIAIQHSPCDLQLPGRTG